MTHTRTLSARRPGRALLVAGTLAGLLAVPASSMDYAPSEAAPRAATTAVRGPDQAPAPAPDQEPPPAPVLSGDPETPYARVAHFYAAYVDVASDPGSNAAATALRAFYLTPAAQKRLADWERRNEADGVLRAQNSPTAWRVTPEGSGMGSTWSTVRLTWGEGKDRRYTYLKVTTELESGKISEITEKY
ncbi:hypothetical protein H9Y04_31050 [Streptomyces sp. TRM66268-LWL]|uniref:Uncharacterized protein n=1 Tax=Streptomyces polyasparticus TaxID=2767826 RepID=A0ABR7SR37_9ACTN|nr:hypothetical protein [Streptomyces polyasparticus]MBC9716981.1 hypothetical protein [Streptomyces polyasparticus]